MFSRSKCVFLQGFSEIRIARCAWGGKVRACDEATLCQHGARRTVCDASMRHDEVRRGEARRCLIRTIPTARWKTSPAFATRRGACFGLMPHPERFVDPTQHPRWTREPVREVGDGLACFRMRCGTSCRPESCGVSANFPAKALPSLGPGRLRRAASPSDRSIVRRRITPRRRVEQTEPGAKGEPWRRLRSAAGR